MNPAPYTSPVAPSNTKQYVIAALLMSALTVIAILLVIMLALPSDRLLLIGVIVAPLTPTTAAVLALMKAQETHKAVNGRLDAFMRASAATSYLTGHEAGRLAAQIQQAAQSAQAVAELPKAVAELPKA
jgi:hypothetical protein